MNKKIIGLLFSTLVFSSAVFPILAGARNISQPLDSARLQMKALVKGLFPRVVGNNITYVTFPGLQQVAIPKDEFSGYIGFFIILGVLEPSS